MRSRAAKRIDFLTRKVARLDRRIARSKRQHPAPSANRAELERVRAKASAELGRKLAARGER